MADSATTRKDFLKKLMFGMGDLITPDSIKPEDSETFSLKNEQVEFLQEYEAWLKEFQVYINKRNENLFDTENNKKLMQLSAEAEKRKPLLEKFMQDTVFASYFNFITKEVTGAI